MEKLFHKINMLVYELTTKVVNFSTNNSNAVSKWLEWWGKITVQIGTQGVFFNKIKVELFIGSKIADGRKQHSVETQETVVIILL